MTIELQIIISRFQGIIDNVELFLTEAEAMACITEKTGCKTMEEFEKWQDENGDHDGDNEYNWFTHPLTLSTNEKAS
jgi:hypothetical protein